MIPSSLRFLSRPFRFLSMASVLLALGAVAACGASPESSQDPTQEPSQAPSPDADASEDPTPDPVPERAVEVFESGSGAATVVFESGLGVGWTPWKPVALEVAAKARVFAYSRPGYGKSDPSPEPRDAAHIVEDLRVLLATRGYAPPYVLVGHSFGGAYMELFAKAHPEEVTGVVLVDTRHRDFTVACEEGGFEGCVVSPEVLATLPQVQQDEVEAFALTSDEIRAVGGFGAYPVRVLTATSHGFTTELETLWESMHTSLAEEAEDGEQTVYPGANHQLQLQRAHEVAEVILSVVSASEE